MRVVTLTLLCVLGTWVQTLAQTAPVDASKIFAYDTMKPLNLTVGKSESPSTGVTVFEISYDSPKGGRVPGYLVVPLGNPAI